jgi:hypothetical protein
MNGFLAMHSPCLRTQSGGRFSPSLLLRDDGYPPSSPDPGALASAPAR